jgi:hypothetical protein
VPGDEGIPQAQNLRFSNVRVNCGTLVASAVPPEKPVNTFELENVTGTCTNGIFLVNMTNVVVKDIKVSGHTEPLVTATNVFGNFPHGE